MATQTVTIYGSASACVDSRTPNKVNNAETIIKAYDSSDYIVHGYEKFTAPKSIQGKKVVSAVWHIYAKIYSLGQGYNIIKNDWNPQKTTFNNSPELCYEFSHTQRPVGSFEWITMEYTGMMTYDIRDAAKLASFGFQIQYGFEYYTSNSDHKPYVVVTVEDDDIGFNIPKPKYPTDGIYIGNNHSVTLQWENLFIKEGFIEPYPQTKAVITWSYNGTTKTATVNGTATNYTIPADQLPEKGIVSWFVTVTGSNEDTNTSTTATFTTADATLYADPITPKNREYVDRAKAVTFVWMYSNSTGTNPSGADFQISTNNGSSWTDLGHTTGYEDLIVDANTLPYANILWRVRGYNSDGVAGPWSNPASFTTIDAICYAYPKSPINEYIDGSKSVTFTWTRSINTGTPANGADFQISNNEGITWTDLGHTTSSLDLIVEPNTLPGGNVLWRVRGYNNDGVAGPWSDPAAIVVRAAPNPPNITSVTKVPRPTVSWQAEGQQAYQLQVGDWDSGTVYGTDKSAQEPYALPNGPTQVRLRIQNNFGLWSNWATTTVTIANKPGKAITVTTWVVQGGVRLTWTTEGTYPTYAILRDGEEIATVAGKEYIDYTGIGKSRYIIRGMNADSTYTDSPAVVEILRLRSGLMAQEGVWEWLLLDRRVDARPAHSGSQEEDITLTWFSGRSLPVAELSGHRQVTARYEYTLPSLTQLEKLRGMSGKKVVYKHRDGEIIQGLLSGLTWSRNRGRWDVSFTITEVDHGPVF